MSEYIKTHKKLVIGVAVALVALAAVALTVFGMSSSEESAPVNQTYTVQYGDIDSTVTGKGYVTSGNKINIVAPVGVVVKDVLVEPGDSVGAGQALANIESASITSELANAISTETQLQSRIDRSGLSSYEIDALTDQRTAVRSYISQLRDLQSYPVITAPQNGIIDTVYLSPGQAIAPYTSQPQSFNSSSSSGSSTSPVNQFIPASSSGLQSSLGNNLRLSIEASGLLVETGYLLNSQPVFPLVFRSFGFEYSNDSSNKSTESQKNSEDNLHTKTNLTKEFSGIIKVSDGEATSDSESGSGSGSGGLNDENSYFNGRSEFTPDTSSSNVDSNLYEQYKSMQSSSSGSPSSGSQGSASSSQGSSGSVPNYTSYDAVAFKLGSMDQLLVNIQVDERDIMSLSPGQQATVKLQALPDEEFVGNISSIAGTAQTSDGNSKYSVEITLNTDRPLKSGMTANVTISTGANQNVLEIPVEALQEDGPRKFVYTSESSDGALGGEVDVTTGLSNKDYVEITSGLQSGMVIYYPQTDSTQNITDITDDTNTTEVDSDSGATGGSE